MMYKDFNTWNLEKQRIHGKEEPKLYHERQIWWCALGANVGDEQDGTGSGYQRPVLILKGMSRTTCYIIPLTTSSKKHKLRAPLGLVDNKEAFALMSQMKIIDTKRLINKIGFLDKDTFTLIRKAAKDLL
ncbi:MAG: type II toxin-antitoxin system PemK/MazF family toxin [bacterium]|nr:type II toxin-antitoxin system PemK/MazF family toxin [bacterium]